ncbi:MAG: hypothetical protein ACR2GI_00630 [Thermomicrobiales bacterium]
MSDSEMVALERNLASVSEAFDRGLTQILGHILGLLRSQVPIVRAHP